MKVAAAAMLATLLAGCVGPMPRAPDAAHVQPPVAWRTSVGPTIPATTTWWTHFGDPVLTQLVEQALANNPDVAIAAARVAEARAQERVARSQLLPSLDLGVSASRSRSLSALGRATESTVAQPVFQAAYEVDLSGRLRDQVEASRETTLATDAAREATTLSVAAATASGYITLRSLDARLDVARTTLKTRAEALRIARSRAQAGYTSQLELRQAQAEFEAAAQIVPQVELAIARQENALHVLAGTPPGPVPRGLPPSQLLPPPVPEGLPSDLLRRRPDIAQAEYTLAASDANLAVARAQFLPQVRLAATAGGLFTRALPDPIAIWSIGGSILAPLFNGGRLRAQADVAASRRDQAAFAYQRTVLNAFREVDDALAATVSLAQQRSALQAEVDALTDALRHATNRYQAGYTSYLEQLDAQRALLNAQLALVQARADELNARVALFQAMGGGWTMQ
ncbi:efflux transporter outer membrane subunit [Lysobacter sp. HA18]